MTQMNHGDKFTHEGKTYTYYAPDKPVIFDPPVEALVWDDSDGPECGGEQAHDLIFYDRRPEDARVIGIHTFWRHMALPAPDDSDEMMTYEELAELLACGYGVVKGDDGNICYPDLGFDLSKIADEVPATVKIKRFRASEWIKPTKRVYREFMREIGRPVI